MLNDELVRYLFDNRPHPLTEVVAGWLGSLRPFATFAHTFRDKIRKKLRSIQTEDGILDLRLELEVAFLLLHERSFSLAYEPQPPGLVRGPDFAVTYTTSHTFMLEITRLRAEILAQSGTADLAGVQSPNWLVSERVGQTIAGKLGQLLPQQSNVLLIGVEGGSLTTATLHAAMIRSRATMIISWMEKEERDVDCTNTSDPCSIWC
ncbi:MAG: hypothetical protein Fur005_16720 [Roseiflexaceae bacterium]